MFRPGIVGMRRSIKSYECGHAWHKYTSLPSAPVLTSQASQKNDIPGKVPVTPPVLTSPETDQFIRRRHPYTIKSALKAVLSRMQLTLHVTRPPPHGALRLVQAMSAWSVKTRRAPSRHCRDSRVYGHTTTAMHDMSIYTPYWAMSSRCKKVRLKSGS